MRRIDFILIKGLDIILSLCGIILTSPLLLIGVIGTLITLHRPPFYRTERIGYRGIPFMHIKLRSMKDGPERGRIFYEQDRLTRFGSWIRSTHIDELPELWLILSGKMSFVGPRPLMRINLKGMDTGIRERMLPGWTCLAQLSLTRKGKLDRFDQFRFDELYFKRRSFTYNIRIISATAFAVLKKVPLDLRPDSTQNRVKFYQDHLQ